MGKQELRNSVRQVRMRLGLSQQELADQVGISRQAVSAIEAGQSAPSTAVSLRMARILGSRIEELFWFDEETPELEALPATGLQAGSGATRVALVRVGGRWVAHPLHGDYGFRQELLPADGEGWYEPGSAVVKVRPLDDPANLGNAIAVAGCTPALSLWARAAERWHPGLRVHWSFANSTEALRALARGEIHAAGSHLYDPETGEHNLPFIRRLLPGRRVVLVNLGVWEEGLLVAPGNPKRLYRGADLVQPGVRVINREEGAGARLLLDRILREDGLPASAVDRNLPIACSHLEVARAIASGQADVGVSAASVAAAFGLGFVPLHRVRYDMVIPKEHLAAEPVRHWLSSLSNRWVRSQLAALGGYDTSQTGEIVGEV